MKLFLEGSLKLTESAGQIKIHGVAIHPMATYHPNELFERRIYIDRELREAAPTLKDKPVLIDHNPSMRVGQVTKSEWSESAKGICYEGIVNPSIASKIRNGSIKHVSVQVDFCRGSGIRFVDGVSPFSFGFSELSLLEHMQPGDARAWVKLAEAMESQEFIQVTIKDMGLFKDDSFRETWTAPDSGVMLVYGVPKEGDGSYQLVHLKFYKLKGWTVDKIESWLRDNPQYSPVTQAQTPTPQILEATSEERLKRKTPLEKWRKSHV